jgi:hypothetical protein
MSYGVDSNPDKGSPKIFPKMQAKNIILTRIYNVLRL